MIHLVTNIITLIKNNVTTSSGMFDIEVEVVMGDVIATYVGSNQMYWSTCLVLVAIHFQLVRGFALYWWQYTFSWLEGSLGNIHKVTIEKKVLP